MFDEDEDYFDERVNVRDLLLYKKGEEIREVVQLLTELMPEDNEYLICLLIPFVSFNFVTCIFKE